jgi:hypothetical protein
MNNQLPQIPQFNPIVSPFKFNAYYDLGEANESNTWDNILQESVHLFGHDIIYLERTVNNPESVFGEYLASQLSLGTPMRMFLEETQGWGGNATDMYSKFNLQISDDATFHASITTFTNAKGPDVKFYPKVGDLIYFLKGKKLFEIQHIENETQPGFYSFGNRNEYTFKCKTYTYDSMQVMVNDTIPTEIQSLNDMATQDQEHFNDVLDAKIITDSIISRTEKDWLTGR